MNRKFVASTLGIISFFALPAAAIAQDAEPGKTYEVEVTEEVANPFVGQFGDVRIGETAIQIPGAKTGEKYMVTVGDTKLNPFTNLQQASCTFKQVGGDREGECNNPPG